MTPDVDANFAAAAKSPRAGAWLLMLPLLLWLLAFVVAPTVIMFVYSFCERDDLGQVVFDFTLDNYRRIFVSEYLAIIGLSVLGAAVTAAVLSAMLLPDWFGSRWFRDRVADRPTTFIVLVAIAVAYYIMRERVFSITGMKVLGVLFNSIELSAVATLICVLIGYPVAYFIGKADERTRNKLLMLVMIPFWTNFLIRTYAWITILRTDGLLQSLLAWAHISTEPLLYTPTAVLIGTVYTYLPFMILPIYGSVEKLDNSLIEAAFDLGASPVRAFSNVIVPLTRPGITAGILLVFVPAVGMFAINDILGGKKDPLIGNVIDQQFKQGRNMPFGSALGIILLILFAVAFFLTLKRRAKILP